MRERYMDGRIVATDTLLAGEPRVEGTEIGVRELYELHEDGEGEYSSAELTGWYDVEKDDIDTAMLYIETTDNPFDGLA